MNDTHPVVERQFKDLIMTKSQKERLRMGCSMFDAAKQIVKNAIINENPEVTPQKMKEEFFLRFYGIEFDKASKEKILEVLNSRHKSEL